MRFTSYLLLLVSFACGIAGSFLVAYTFFWRKPNFTVPPQTIPIIVARTDIAAGVELTASLVAFERVAVDEIPERAVARFSDIVNQRTLYPIAQGYPICRDMIAARRSEANQTAPGFVPIGFRVVPVEVSQPKATPPLAVDGRVNLMVDQSENASRFVMMRKETLGDRTTMKQVLSGVMVHSVSEVAATDDTQHHIVSLLLTPEQYEALLAASQEGKLRIAIATPVAEIATVTPVAEIATAIPVAEIATAAPVAASPIADVPAPAPVLVEVATDTAATEVVTPHVALADPVHTEPTTPFAVTVEPATPLPAFADAVVPPTTEALSTVPAYSPWGSLATPQASVKTTTLAAPLELPPPLPMPTVLPAPARSTGRALFVAPNTQSHENANRSKTGSR